ncbi:hypothetical protein DRN98_07695 [Methanosarcinales archaeon]|nr:MAG: hypothetical protein DRN98_07695 [Methanosarcinales archaeon]
MLTNEFISTFIFLHIVPFLYDLSEIITKKREANIINLLPFNLYYSMLSTSYIFIRQTQIDRIIGNFLSLTCLLTKE